MHLSSNTQLLPLRWLVCLIALAGWGSQLTLRAQDIPATGGIGSLLGNGSGDDEAGYIKYSAKFEMEENSNRGLLTVTAELAEGWHTFSVTQPKGGPRRTMIEVTSEALLTPSDKLEFKPDHPPKIRYDKLAFGDVPIEEHEGMVTWTAPIELMPDAKPEEVKLNLHIRAQRCKVPCVPINEKLVAEFSAYYNAAKTQPMTPAVTTVEPIAAITPPSSATTALTPKLEVVSETAGKIPFWKAIAFGMLGGFILNFMPCVLPVIGLKIIAFAQQAGHSRARVFALNLAYCLGLLLVFMVLATLAAFFDFGWSRSFQNATFRYILLGVVFTMGLSFLGVWEIPIPGFVGGGGANKLQNQEGYTGAFFKGIFTTILATPCSGPFLSGVFFYTVTAKWYETYAIFGSIGLGMALPYLLIGMEPRLIRWLPKPGEWMDTFKQLLGFSMLGASIYFFSAVNQPGNTLALLTMLFGLGFACWWIGKVPNYAEAKEHVVGWLSASAMAGAIIFAGFYYLDSSRLLRAAAPGNASDNAHVSSGEHLFQWQMYSPEALAKAQAEGKTVMIEFTATWCPNCIWNMKTAINTPEVKQVIEENGVVALLADWTDGDADISKKLDELGSITIPFLAVYSGEHPEKVFVLPDVITKAQLVETLKKAGPSQKR
jgi:thiol:disulfide interchange protein